MDGIYYFLPQGTLGKESLEILRGRKFISLFRELKPPQLASFRMVHLSHQKKNGNDLSDIPFEITISALNAFP